MYVTACMQKTLFSIGETVDQEVEPAGNSKEDDFEWGRGSDPSIVPANVDGD